MARDLYQTNARFRATCEELDAIMRPAWGRSLIEEILRGDETVYQSDIGQPVLFALQVGVYRLYVDAGHSARRWCSATVSAKWRQPTPAGADARRRRQSHRRTGQGAGTHRRRRSHGRSGNQRNRGQEYIARYPNWLSIAAFNSATDLTLAGDEASIKAVVE